jgi:hypothetical protein
MHLHLASYYYEKEDVIMKQIRKLIPICSNINNFIIKQYYIHEPYIHPYDNPKNIKYSKPFSWVFDPELKKPDNVIMVDVSSHLTRRRCI